MKQTGSSWRVWTAAGVMTALFMASPVSAQRGQTPTAGTVPEQVARLLDGIALSVAQKKSVDSIVMWATAEQERLKSVTRKPDGTFHVKINAQSVRQLYIVEEQWPKSIRDQLTRAQQKTWDMNHKK